MPGIPICVYKSNMKMFHVTLYKGKSFFSGGFGVIGPACSPTSNFGTVKEIRYEDTITADSNGNGDIIQVGVKLRSVDINGIPFHEKPATKTEASYVEPDITMPTTTAQSALVDNGDNIYLFLEEALYLQERGLLQVLYETGGKPMDSSHLFFYWKNMTSVLVRILRSLIYEHKYLLCYVIVIECCRAMRRNT